MVKKVLEPGVVGVARGWGRAVLPAAVLLEGLAGPVGNVEGRVSNDVIGAEVGVSVIKERAFGIPLEVRRIDAADGEIHFGQSPGRQVRFLAVDADPFRVSIDELLGLDEHPAGSAAGIVDAALVRLEHLDEEFDDGAGRVELSALLAFGESELAEEILEDVTENVGTLLLSGCKVQVREHIDQLSEDGSVQVLAGVDFWEDALQLVVFLLDGVHGRVESSTDGWRLGVIANMGPAGGRRDEENAFGGVLVAVFGVGAHLLLTLQALVDLLKSLGDVAEEDEAEDDMLVLGGIDVLAELIGGFKELAF